MFDFKTLFGLEPCEIKKTCILVPILTKGMLDALKIKNLSKGTPYSCASSENFTLIHSRVGAPFSGDCVLHLKNTACENVILFGSCGLVEKTNLFNVGSIVTPTTGYSFESFSSLLLNKNKNPHLFTALFILPVCSGEIKGSTFLTIFRS